MINSWARKTYEASYYYYKFIATFSLAVLFTATKYAAAAARPNFNKLDELIGQTSCGFALINQANFDNKLAL